jgi:hypothetical protein
VNAQNATRSPGLDVEDILKVLSMEFLRKIDALDGEIITALELLKRIKTSLL